MIVHSLAAAGLTTRRPQICIVGAGAAGISLACELDGLPIEVVLLESGGIKPSAASSGDYAGTARPPHPDPREYRRAHLGGTTSLWGGRCTPMDPIDFEPRATMPNSGWPIGFDEIARWYPKAMAYCDAGAAEFSASRSLPTAAPLVPGLADDALLRTDVIERYSLPTHFGKRYSARLSASRNVTVVLNSRCVQLYQSADGEPIEAIEVVGDGGDRLRLVADVFVLATGGIETARLLLASSAIGIGNSRDLVGRYYACHFENVVGNLITGGKGAQFDFEKTTDGVYSRRKFLFQEQAIREHDLLNTAFRLHFPNYSDARHRNAVMSSIFLVKSLLKAEQRAILRHGSSDAVSSPRWQHLRNVLLGMPTLLKFAWKWLFHGILATRKLPYTLQPNADGSYPLEFNCEQTPLPESRITLDRSRRDRHGLPHVHIDWKLAEEDVQRACRGFTLLAETVSRVPGIRFEYEPATLEQTMRSSVPLGGHHLGTARMGDSADTGVVNSDCAVFGAPNLYIASSAVFCTSSHANPTLTIVAIAVRMAAHLKTRFAGSA